MTSRLLLSALTLASVSCTITTDEHESWKSMSEEQVRSALQSPTAEFEERLSQDVVSMVERKVPALVETAHFLTYMATAVSDVANADPSTAEELPEITEAEEDPNQVWGTSLFVKIACPGQKVLPPYDFENGNVRLLSPELKSLDVGPLLSGGEFLLDFNECDLGPFSLDAELPGRYLINASYITGVEVDDPDAPLFALALNVGSAEKNGTDGPLGYVAVACGTQSLPCTHDIRVAAELNAGDYGTYVISFRMTNNFWTGTEEISVEVKGANGEARCSYSSSFYYKDFSCEAI